MSIATFPMRKYCYYARYFFIAAVVLWLTLTCAAQLKNRVSIHLQSSVSNCHWVEHDRGKSCIPFNPKRIVVTSEELLDHLLVLGITPVASAEKNIAGSRGKQFGDRLTNVDSIGKDATPNLEKILKLNPDLIISYPYQPYELLSKIAPTVVLKIKWSQGSWKETLQELGKILGRSQEAEEALSQYQRRVDQLKSLILQEYGKPTVSISRFYAGQNLPQFDTMFSFSGWILQEVGLYPPQHQLELIDSPDVGFFSINLERIDLLDADILFTMLDPGAANSFKKYQESPLWQKLKVAQNEKVYVVDSGYWYFGGLLAANAVLDDLEKYLINTP